MRRETAGTVVLGAILIVGLALAPLEATAQASGGAVAPDLEDARALYEKARAVEATDDRSQQMAAAWLYREAARLWPEAHEKRYRSLWRAAHLYLHHGRAAKAAALLAEAGRQARANGRPGRAATCYLRLARLAAEAGEEGRARSVLQTVQPLLEKEAVDRKKREQLRTMTANVRTVITELAESS